MWEWYHRSRYETRVRTPGTTSWYDQCMDGYIGDRFWYSECILQAQWSARTKTTYAVSKTTYSNTIYLCYIIIFCDCDWLMTLDSFLQRRRLQFFWLRDWLLHSNLFASHSRICTAPNRSENPWANNYHHWQLIQQTKKQCFDIIFIWDEIYAKSSLCFVNIHCYIIALIL